ncbi:DUF4352 domain-containing protein [Halobacillus sp. Marseille-P3879]|uniref:DUF4352 domain-containing protein n=1 Tax=Halobacillus sp. Marseille-P3879 TaxID=2045014 RepID=UPI001F3BDAD1|nr:DUF4352 domain-containing protein [Halobacillus sp. Marseille-P3879]
MIGAFIGDDEDEATGEENTEQSENEQTSEEKESSDEKEAEEAAAEKETESNDEEEVKNVGVGEGAEIANTTFTVNDVEETSEIDSGNEFIENATTDGKYVIADVTIQNDKDESLTIDSSFFSISADGAEYDPVTDGDVIMAMSEEDDFFLEQINPGLSKSGKVVFEVSADVELADTTLHAQTGFFGTESIEIDLNK